MYISAAIGEDTERCAEAEIGTEGSVRWGRGEESMGIEGERVAAQCGGRVELSEAETFWDGPPSPSPRSRRPPRL